MVDVFVDELELTKGMQRYFAGATRRPAYHPATLSKICVYDTATGYLHRKHRKQPALSGKKLPVGKETARQLGIMSIMTEKPSHISLRWIWLVALIVVLDQGTKHLVVGSLQTNRPMGILPSVELLLSYNKGISFSWFQFSGDVQRWPLVGLSILAAGLLGWWLGRVPSGRPILATGLALILGGALGNMLDRARIGSVIDFVHVFYKAWSFAVFNVADAAITMGVIAILASTYLETSGESRP